MAKTNQAAPRTVIALAEGHSIEIDGPEVRYITPQRILWAYTGENSNQVWISIHTFDGVSLQPILAENFISIVDKRRRGRQSPH